MTQTTEDFYVESRPYVGIFDTFAKRHRIEGITKADHICYKCGSKESFETMRALFESESDFIYQSIISKRRIACIKLKKGIETVIGTISLLELSDQKPDGSQKDSFDHIEAYPLAPFTYDEMVQRLAETEKVIKVERPHHTTHDIEIANEFLFRCTEGPLIEKIKSSEMN